MHLIRLLSVDASAPTIASAAALHIILSRQHQVL